MFATTCDDQACSAKLQLIRKIKNSGKYVRHIIIRHGLTEREALLLEATIIDLWEFEEKGLTNKASGHRTIEKGIMTADDIVRTVNAEPVQAFEEPSIVININRTYRRGSGPKGILKWSQKTGQSAKVYPKPLKGYENGEAPELYRPV
ncbi:hypothetical protein [Roseovarius sp. A-2]|uniref:LEM-3-like GIY-YIG domain-containing protein n=1 Tax=Roseovarius sp. A-2 TaxID=1570360 RepID=UPI0035E45C07